jgi:hypothetical protein
MAVQQCDATTPTLLTQAQVGSAEFIPSVIKLRANILHSMLKYAYETSYTETALYVSCIPLTLVYYDGLSELPYRINFVINFLTVLCGTFNVLYSSYTSYLMEVWFVFAQKSN